MSASVPTIERPLVLAGDSRATTEPTAVAPPARADGVELLGTVAGSGYRRQPALVRRGDGQTIQLTPLLYGLLEAVDGERDLDALAAELGTRVGRAVTADDVHYLVEGKLRPLGVLRRPDGTQPATHRANPLLALRLKLAVSSPAATRRVARPFAALFRPWVVVPVLAAFAVTTWWVGAQKGLASAAHQALYEPETLLLVFALTLLSAAFHELGHAAACRYGGADPGRMGVGLYLVWPAFYTDVTDSYRLPRWGRLRVDLGGLYFNAVFSLIALAVWAAVGWDALLLVIAAQLLQMARQLVPVVRFDGYHILADLTGVPDLFHHIKPTLLGLLPWRWARAEGKALKPWARAIVTLWVLFVVPLLGAMIVGVVLVFPRIAATAWDSLGLQWDALVADWAQPDAAGIAVALLSMLLISLPVLGIVYLLARIVRRMVRRVVRSTAGRPAWRAAAALAGAMVVVGVAWAWWPNGQYTPIRSDEGWAVPQLRLAAAPVGLSAKTPLTAPTPTLPAPAPPSATPAVAPPPAPRAPSRNGHWIVALLPVTDTGQPILPPAEAPPAVAGPDEPPAVPAPAVPAPAAPEPVVAAEPDPVALLAEAPPAVERESWPFPFAPPRAPEPGDNQAVAVNTTDGSTQYKVAVALVWVNDGEPVGQRNEAYALASCTDCRTVAVAFQVVLVVGYTQVVTPINAAVAVNWACNACTTTAIALQLVATLSRTPTESTMAELNELWGDLEERSESFRLRPLTDVLADLVQTRAQVVEILASEDDAGVALAADAGATVETTAATAQQAGTDAATDVAAGEEPPAATDEPTASTTTATTTTSGESPPTGDASTAPAETEPCTTPPAAEEPSDPTAEETTGECPPDAQPEAPADAPADEAAPVAEEPAAAMPAAEEPAAPTE